MMYNQSTPIRTRMCVLLMALLVVLGACIVITQFTEEDTSADLSHICGTPPTHMTSIQDIAVS